MTEQHTGFHYDGFSSPNGTIVPDDFFDLLAPNLSEAELRVLLYIIRRTFGFKKDKDNISLKQMVEGIRTKDGKVLDRGAGVAKSAAARAVKGLVGKGIIIATRNSSPEKGDEPTTYQIRFRRGEKAPSLPVSSKRTRGVPPREHARVLERDTQQTVLQQTDVNHSNIRKAESLGGSNTQPTESTSGRGDTEYTQHKRYKQPGQERKRGRGFSSIGDTLARSNLNSPARPYGEERQVILEYVTGFAQEFSDHASLKTSTSRAYNLFKQTRLPLGTFLGRMHEARAITKESSGHDTRPAKKKMAYFFACLEDRLGLRQMAASESG